MAKRKKIVTKETDYIGIDPGASYLKGAHGNTCWIESMAISPQGNVVPSMESLPIPDASINDTIVLKGDDGWYVFGDIVPLIEANPIAPTGRKRYSTRTFVRQIIAASIYKSRIQSPDLRVFTNMPYTLYNDEALVNQFKKNAIGEYRIISPHEEWVTTVTEVSIQPEPAPFAMALLYGANGELTKFGKEVISDQKLWAIADIGAYSTDARAYIGATRIDAQTNSIEVGVNNAIQLVQREIKQTTGVSVSIQDIRQAARKGSIDLNGKPYKLNGQVAQAERTTYAQILTFLTSLWPQDTARMSHVFVVGGGCAKIGRQITSEFPSAVTIGTLHDKNTLTLAEARTDPRMAQAVGNLIVAKLTAGAS